MTNEDKVNIIIGRVRVMLPMMRSQLGDSVTGYAEFFKKSLLNMAEWKDQQFKEYLEELKNRYGKEYKDVISNNDDYVVGRAYGGMDAIIKIINELFGGE